MQFLLLLAASWNCQCGLIFPRDTSACPSCSATRASSLQDWVDGEKERGRAWTCAQVAAFNQENVCNAIKQDITTIDLQACHSPERETAFTVAEFAMSSAKVIASVVDRCPRQTCLRTRAESTVIHIDTVTMVCLSAVAHATGMAKEAVLTAMRKCYAELQGVDSYKEALAGIPADRAHPVTTVDILQWSALLESIR